MAYLYPVNLFNHCNPVLSFSGVLHETIEKFSLRLDKVNKVEFCRVVIFATKVKK